MAQSRTPVRGTVLGLAVMLAAVLAPSPQRPVFPDSSHTHFQRSIDVEQAGVSQVFYLDLADDAPSAWIAFEGHAGDRVPLRLGVPQVPRLRDFRPSLAVLGPGLPPADLPFDALPGPGGLVFSTASVTSPETHHDALTDTRSWLLLDETVTLPQDGQYYLFIYDLSGRGEKLWVAMWLRGGFGLGEIPALPAWIAETRRFHEVGGPPLWAWWGMGAVAVSVVAATAWGIRAGKRARQRIEAEVPPEELYDTELRRRERR